MKFLNRSKFFNYYLPLILTAIILLVSAGIYLNLKKPTKEAEAAWFSSSWTYRKPITIDRTKLSTTATSTFSNFPILISITDSDLKSTGNGGKQASSTGVDILFTDTNGTSKLDHEVETYASTTGQLIAWVRIPTLTSSANYTIYIYFGNSNASDQSNKIGVWNFEYRGVWHLPNGTALTALDSTSNASNGTVTGTVTATAGQIDGGASFPGTTNNYIGTPSINLGTVLTVEGWANPSAIGANSPRIAENTFQTGFFLGISGTTNYWFIINSNFTVIGGAASLNKWAYVVGVYDGTFSSLYVNGLLVAGPTSVAAPTVGAAAIIMGDVFAHNDSNSAWNGKLDEIRVSTTNRSIDWLATQYNNMNEPSLFYSYGSLGIINRAANTGAEAVRGKVKVRGGVKFR